MKQKRSKHFFHAPLARCIFAILPFMALSLFTCLIVKLIGVWMPPFYISVITLLAYLAWQYFDLSPYIVLAPSIKSVTRTNVLAYAMLSLISILALVGLLFFFGNDTGSVLFTWFFMPMKLFYYAGLTGKLISAILVGLIAFAFSLLPPFFVDFSKPEFPAYDADEAPEVKKEEK